MARSRCSFKDRMQRQSQHLSGAARINTDLFCCWETESGWFGGGSHASCAEESGRLLRTRRLTVPDASASSVGWFPNPAVVVPRRKAVKVLRRNVSTVSLAARPRLGFRARTVDCTSAADIPSLSTFHWPMRRKIVHRREI